ncbi:MFS transporter [Crateriforma conspicua]|uniref:Major Facilitator Superfamily protein n=1 Tax=Crateriforma conspicua TaxID=2527996 RepID=A0A5C5Y359_9PLAN|nr:MFS transporter [Crateriforma conspicua]QDV63297.1 Major Facilitator Superfamily protein [Crateriforma conspicua]TWT67932.1 Major Facilitator Superfamily protein [Crateriforma conspicua]
MDFARGKLMLASFLTLVASGIGFATRTAAGGPWEREFNIGGGQFGAILGAGFLGFGLMIFFGGILVEKFGYKKLLMLAFVLHLVSAVMLFIANPLFDGWRESDPENATQNVFNVLFWSAFLFSICQGLYEAVINPLIAQLYPDNKTHYLNILHAGWPAGMIVGGLFAAGFIGEEAWFTELPWQWALASFAIVVVAYGIMVIPEKFPETVGESSSDFATVFSCFASIPFLVLIVLHALIGYMELGVDSWMTKLMENLLPNSVLILVYTSMLMFVLRFFAGPIVHKINPIGLLLGSSVIACLGLLWLGSPIQSVGMIFVAATFYSLGKAFLWPTMLGVAGERYPQSGSVAMGALGAAGMLCVGQIAGPRIGTQQGFSMSENLQQTAPETFERYAEPEAITAWGYEYRPLDAAKLNAANGAELGEDGKPVSTQALADAELIDEADKEVLLANADTDFSAVQDSYLFGGRRALTLTSYVPATMAIGFLGLLIYYRSIGGYKAIKIDHEHEDAEVPVPHEATEDPLERPAPTEY